MTNLGQENDAAFKALRDAIRSYSASKSSHEFEKTLGLTPHVERRREIYKHIQTHLAHLAHLAPLVEYTDNWQGMAIHYYSNILKGNAKRRRIAQKEAVAVAAAPRLAEARAAKARAAKAVRLETQKVTQQEAQEEADFVENNPLVFD
jgi:hypothetical protein